MNKFNGIIEDSQVKDSSEELDTSSVIGLECRAEKKEASPMLPAVINSEGATGKRQSNTQACDNVCDNNKQNGDSNWESNYKELEISKSDEKSPYYHDAYGSLWKRGSEKDES
jgi:hypothetical protein